MTWQSAGSRLALTLAACALLASCALEPPKPAPRPATVTPRPTAPPTHVKPLPPPAAGEPWASLAPSLVMHDCNGSPLVQAQLARYTRSPMHLEQMLQRALPLMMYVRDQLQDAGIPGEFVMLPMLESEYDPAEPSRRGDPAGMWQLMPATARRHGIKVTRQYDGRLDPLASTRVAVKMLVSFGERFDDWRLADMAYNAGSNAVARAVARHPDLGSQPIPDIPVSTTTRKHLAKLMALSCIVRQPERFHIELPKPTAGDRLATVDVPVGLGLREAARMAGMPQARLQALNPGYLGNRVPAESPGKLLLPSSAAGSLAAALAADDKEPVAEVDTPRHGSGSPAGVGSSGEPATSAGKSAGSSARAPTASAVHYRVRKGETLWSIARRYHATIAELKRWNDLEDANIQPGQELRVRDQESGR